MNVNENSPEHISETRPAVAPETKAVKEKSLWRELVEFALIAILVVVPFRIFIAQPYVVNGASMSPTFETGNYLIVDQLTYRFTTPARGSVIIFKYPLNTSWYFIKRVIGFPGETVNIKNGAVSITKVDGTTIALNEPYIKFPKTENYTKTLGSAEYFVMGDNRLGSADSRMWGPLPASDIIGRPILRLFPLTQIGILPGDETGVITSK